MKDQGKVGVESDLEYRIELLQWIRTWTRMGADYKSSMEKSID